MRKERSKMKYRAKIKKNEEGFSLVEVLIVVLIISILAVAAIPQIQRNLQLYRLESISGLLSSRLMEAKLTAVKHNRAAWLEINTTAKTLEVWTTNELNQPIRTKLAVTIPDNVSFDAASPSRITFNSLGRNQANSNSIVKLKLANANFCKMVTVSAVGNLTSGPC
ncbi:MAG: prepilin-type N-terminal cleavage/methylation domain-containing protein [Pyrinomonadaceae bacterium]